MFNTEFDVNWSDVELCKLSFTEDKIFAGEGGKIEKFVELDVEITLDWLFGN